MAKAKVKEMQLCTRCTETKDGWTWETDSFVWEYLNRPGINLFVTHKDDPEKRPQPVIFARALGDAVMFSQGFCGGAGWQRRFAETNSKAEDEPRDNRGRGE